MDFNKKNLLIALAVALVIGGGIYFYNKKKSQKLVTKATQSLEGKTIYNPDIAETEGKVWTLVDGIWHAPIDWASLPIKRESAILSSTYWTKEDFLKFPKGEPIDYNTLPNFQ